MPVSALKEYWALVAAVALATLVLVILLVVLYRRSRRGRLGKLLRDRKHELKALKAAAAQLEKASRRLERLEQSAGRQPPKKLDTARGARDDATMLCEIRQGTLAAAEHRLRQLIVEEYPPNSHDRMRQRYALTEHADVRPFSFDGRHKKAPPRGGARGDKS